VSEGLLLVIGFVIGIAWTVSAVLLRQSNENHKPKGET